MNRIIIIMMLTGLLVITGCKRVDVPAEEAVSETQTPETTLIGIDHDHENSDPGTEENALDKADDASIEKSVVLEVKAADHVNFQSLEKAIADFEAGADRSVDEENRIINLIYRLEDKSFSRLDFETVRDYYYYDVWPDGYDNYRIQIGVIGQNGLIAAHSFNETEFYDDHYYDFDRISYVLADYLQYVPEIGTGDFNPKLADNLGQSIEKITLGKTTFSLYQTYSDVVCLLSNDRERLFHYNLEQDIFYLPIDGFDFQVDLTDDDLVFELFSTLEKTVEYNSLTDQIDVTELASGEKTSHDYESFSLDDLVITEDELIVYPVKDRASFVDAVGPYRKLSIAPELAQEDMRFDEVETDNPYFAALPYESSVYGVKWMMIEGSLDTPIPFMTGWVGHVLTFSDCDEITIRNLDLGHMTMEECFGDVIHLSRSGNISIENCILFGSGINGVSLNHRSAARVEDTKIWDCSTSGVYMMDDESRITLDRCLIESTPYAFEFENAFCEPGQLIVSNSRIDAVMYPHYDFRYNDRFDQVGLARLNTVEDEMIFENVLYSPSNMVNFEQISTFFKDEAPSDFIYVAPVDESGSYRVTVDLTYEGELSDFNREKLEAMCDDLPETLFDVTVLFNQDWKIRVYDSEGVFLAEFIWKTWRKEMVDLKVDSQLTENFFGMKSINVQSEILTVLEHNNVIGEVATYDDVQAPVMTNEGMIHQIDVYYYNMDTELYGNLLYSLLYNQSKNTYELRTDQERFVYDATYDGPVLEVLNGIDDIIQAFQPTSEIMISGKAYVAATYEYESINDFKAHLNTYMTATMAEWYIETMDLLDKDGIIYTSMEPFYMRYGMDSYILPVKAADRNTVEVTSLVNDLDGYRPVTMLFGEMDGQWKLIGIKE